MGIELNSPQPAAKGITRSLRELAVPGNFPARLCSSAEVARMIGDAGGRERGAGCGVRDFMHKTAVEVIGAPSKSRCWAVDLIGAASCAMTRWWSKSVFARMDKAS